MEVDENTWTNQAAYHNLSKKFSISEQDRKGAFARQYYEVYEARLNEMRPRIMKKADDVIGKGKYKLVRLSDAAQNEQVFIVGVIVKRLSERPSILKELLCEDKVAYEDYDENEDVEGLKRYAGNSEDKIELESDKQTIRLTGNITMNDCATGCCVGLFGKLLKEGVLHVDQVIWPDSSISRSFSSDCKCTIAIISGLELTGNIVDDRKTISSFELMTSWLKGEIAAPGEEAKHIPLIDRLIILGPSIGSNQNGCDVQAVVRTLTLSRQERQMSTKALTMVDKLISSLTDKIQVDVVSGIGDPCSSMWPQPPIHRVCLPRSGLTEKKVNLVSNPYEFELDKVHIGAVSGENVSDLLRTSLKWTGCDVLENIVKWQHYAPNCPDSLDGFPVSERDPLIMSSTPHILVCGNQPRGEVRRVKIGDTSDECLTICIPKFSKSQIVCLVNLEDLKLSWRAFEHDF